MRDDLVNSAVMDFEAMRKRLKTQINDAAVTDLKILYDRLAEKNKVMNLVGPSSLTDYWSRHVLDSAQLLDFAPRARRWADLGAGAGFPGLVLAIMLKHAPNAHENDAPCHVYLIDSLAKRCLFLTQIVDELDLPASVINDRAENVALKVDVVTARALAPLAKLLGYAQSFFDQGAQGWFLKGENVENELKEAMKTWQFESQLHVSLSDSRGRVTHIQRLSHAR